MSQSKMTLQEYIQSRNYKRRLSSRSKSKQKPSTQVQSPQPKPSIDPSTISVNSEPKNQQKLYSTPQMSDLVKEIKEVDESVQGFSRLHKKVEDIKEFARQYIHDDKIFVTFCKSLFELEAIYRLELIEAYRYQLFKYQFENQNQKNLDESKKRMLKDLNEHYMNSKFQYKKVILKEKNELTKSQKLVLQEIIQVQSKPGTTQSLMNAELQPLAASSVEGQNLLKEPILQKRPTSFLQAFLPRAQNNLTSQTNLTQSKFISATEYSTATTNPEIPKKDKLTLYPTHPNKPIYKDPINLLHHQQPSPTSPQPQKQPRFQVRVNNTHFVRSPTAKKVVFLPNEPIRQTAAQYDIPTFQSNKSSLKSNPEEGIALIDQSDVVVAHSDPRSSTPSSELENNNFMVLLDRQFSKGKGKQPSPSSKGIMITEQYCDNKVFSPACNNRGHSPAYNEVKKKTAREILEQRERQKLLQSKDYLRVKRA